MRKKIVHKMISFYYNFLLIDIKILEAINFLSRHFTSKFRYEHTAVTESLVLYLIFRRLNTNMVMMKNPVKIRRNLRSQLELTNFILSKGDHQHSIRCHSQFYLNTLLRGLTQ